MTSGSSLFLIAQLGQCALCGRLVRAMDTVSQLERARTAEAEFGKSRETVLGAVDRRLDAVRDGG